MFDVFEKFATDETKEECGVEVSLGKGVNLVIARANNAAFMKLIQEEADRVAEQSMKLSEEDAETLDKDSMLAVLAKTILLGWSGVSYKGKPMKYSVDNAKTLLRHKDFRKLVMEHANDFEHYKAKLEDVDEKNLQLRSYMIWSGAKMLSSLTS